METLFSTSVFPVLYPGLVSARTPAAWVKLYEGDLPASGRLVELELHGDPRLRRGEFLWNGFWMLDEGEIIGGGRVARWRPLDGQESR